MNSFTAMLPHHCHGRTKIGSYACVGGAGRLRNRNPISRLESSASRNRHENSRCDAKILTGTSYARLIITTFVNAPVAAKRPAVTVRLLSNSNPATVSIAPENTWYGVE